MVPLVFHSSRTIFCYFFVVVVVILRFVCTAGANFFLMVEVTMQNHRMQYKRTVLAQVRPFASLVFLLFLLSCVFVFCYQQWHRNESATNIYIYIYIRSSTGHWSWSVFQDLFPFLRPGTENTNEPKMIKYAFVRTQSEIGNVHCVPNKNGMEQKRGTSTFHFHFFLFLFFIYLFGGEIRKMSWCRE